MTHTPKQQLPKNKNTQTRVGFTLALAIPPVVIGILGFPWGGYYVLGYAVVQIITAFIVSNLFRYNRWAYISIVLLPIVVFGGLALMMWVSLAQPDTGMQELFFAVGMMVFIALAAFNTIYNLTAVFVQFSLLKQEGSRQATNAQTLDQKLAKTPGDSLPLASAFTLKLLVPTFISLIAGGMISVWLGFDPTYILLYNILEFLISLVVFFGFAIFLFKHYRDVLYGYLVVPFLPIVTNIFSSGFGFLLALSLRTQSIYSRPESNELFLGIIEARDLVIITTILFPVFTFICQPPNFLDTLFSSRVVANWDCKHWA